MIAAENYQSLGHALSDALTRFESNTAVVEMDRRAERERLSYQDFKCAAKPVAGFLQSLGVGPESRVAIIMSNQSKWLLAAYASFVRGAILVPIDYKLTAAEQLTLLRHSRAQVLFIEHPLWTKLAPHRPDVRVIVSDCPAADESYGATDWSAIKGLAFEPDPVQRTRADTACIVYSSGTGGKPKGCMMSHGNYLAQFTALSTLFPLQESDRFFSVLPTNHAIDFMCGFIGPLLSGAQVVHQRVLRPEFLLDTMRQCKITQMAVVPLLLEAFDRAIREQIEARGIWARRTVDLLRAFNRRFTTTRPRYRLSRLLLVPIHKALGGHLRLLFCGGAMVNPQQAEFLYSCGIGVVIGYGLTEAGTVVTLNDLQPFKADTVGRPLPGTTVRIAHPDVSGVGEVQVMGDTVMQGYLDEPELTAQAFEQGWLRTGDQGRMDASGHLQLVGRTKNMVVTAGGKNVYPEDVESVFVELPCKEFAVMASHVVWPTIKLGDDCLVAVANVGDDPSAFIEALRLRNLALPDYKRLRGVVLWDSAFPRTASLKLKRQSLAEQMRERLSEDCVESL